jgi:hypothetical protein
VNYEIEEMYLHTPVALFGRLQQRFVSDVPAGLRLELRTNVAVCASRYGEVTSYLISPANIAWLKLRSVQ